MRVISGSRRGTNLMAPAGNHTRPTTDRTKETLFNVLMPYVYESSFLDLFSGSGSIAIEALSRGAKRAVLVENDRSAIQCMEANLKKTRFDGEESRIYPCDAGRALELMGNEGLKFDLVFMDPPYNMDIEKNILIKIKELSLLKEEAIIVVEASKDTDFSYLEKLSYVIWKKKEYKTNQHVFILEETSC